MNKATYREKYEKEVKGFQREDKAHWPPLAQRAMVDRRVERIGKDLAKGEFSGATPTSHLEKLRYVAAPYQPPREPTLDWKDEWFDGMDARIRVFLWTGPTPS